MNTPLALSNASDARNFVFISYSHKDKVWLERLRVLLKPYEKQGRLTPWADPYIPIGGRWQRDIEQALRRTRIAVLLVSPDFLASDFIEEEELPPLYDGADRGEVTLIPIPIKASAYHITRLKDYQWPCDPETPLDGLAAADRNRTLVKIVDKIAEAVRHSVPAPAVTPERSARQEPLQAVAVTGRLAQLHGVPGQRPHYRRRDDSFELLKQAVLSTTHQAIGITGTVPTADLTRLGLHGMGGIGKTVLAIDLVTTEEIRRTFPDGIFWLTLGQNPEPLELQGKLARFIAGEPRAIATVDDGRDQLQQLFAGKACLLVLDDLWRVQDADPFDVLGPRSRLLATTRDADLLVALGARELPLDVLNEDLALDLLASWSGQARDRLPPVARQVADRCGYLPLALALVGARVRGGGRWKEVQAALELGQLEFLDHPYGSVFTSLRLSTDALSAAEAERYFDLAAFPEDVDVPVETVAILWQHTGRLDADQAHDLLRRFDRKSLLTLSQDGQRVSFHDLQHDFLRLNVDSLAAAQGALIGAYRSRCADGWATGPDDGYFFQYLPYHFVESGRLDDLRALLADYDWLAAKLKATDVPSVLADYQRAPDEPHLGLIERALRLSTGALARDLHHLPSQLLGRLRGVEDRRIQALLEKAGARPGTAWLCPHTASLLPPGPLVQTLTGHTRSVEALTVLPDGRVVSGSEDRTLRVWDAASGASRVLEGHTDEVTVLAVLPDGRVVSGSKDKTLRVWNVASGASRVLEGHTEEVRVLAVLPDGRVVSGSWDATLRVWDVDSGASRVLEGDTDTDWVEALTVLPDGRVVSGSYYKTLRVWDVASGASRVLEGHTEEVRVLAVLPDGRVVSGSKDKTLRVWDVASGASRVLEGHTDEVRVLAVLPDGRVVSGSDDKTLRVWEVDSGASRVLEGHTDTVWALAVLPDGRVVSGSVDRTLRVWEVDSDASRALKGHAATVIALAVLPDGRVVSGSVDGTLGVWEVDSGASRALEGHSKEVEALAVLPDGRVVSGSDDKTLRVWDVASGVSRVLTGHTKWIRALAVLPDGRVVSGSLHGPLWVWDVASGASRALEGHTGTVTALAVLPDGRVVSGSADGTLRVWDVDSGVSRVLTGHTDVVTALAVLPDGRVVSGSDDKTLRVWDVPNDVSRVLKGHTKWVRALAVLPDGRVVSGSLHGPLWVWDVASGASRALEGHTDEVRVLAVLPDGRVVSSAGSFRDQTLRVWDVDSGASRALEGHTGTVTALAVLPDGRVVSGSRDQTLRVWEVDSGASRVLEGHTDVVTVLAVLPDGRVVSGSWDWTVILWDLETANSISAFVGDAGVTACVAARVDCLVVGSANGAVHILEVVAASVPTRAK